MKTREKEIRKAKAAAIVRFVQFGAFAAVIIALTSGVMKPAEGERKTFHPKWDAVTSAVKSAAVAAVPSPKSAEAAQVSAYLAVPEESQAPAEIQATTTVTAADEAEAYEDLEHYCRKH